MSLSTKLKDWCDGNVELRELQAGLESARRSLEEHRQGFSQTLKSLEESELVHGSPLQQYCLEVMGRLEDDLNSLRELSAAGDRETAISLADRLDRSSFQLNQALWEFRNQVLLVRGPTEIPSLNLLYSLKGEYEREPGGEVRQRFLEALQAEIDLARKGVQDLERESLDSPTLPALRRTFLEHIGHLKGLRAALLEEPSDRAPDLFGYLLQLNLTYTELFKLTPVVSAELRDRGETPFSEVNKLLTLLGDVQEGQASEQLLLEALESFEESLEQLDQGLTNGVGSQVSEHCLESLDEVLALFSDGVGFVCDFVDGRDVKFLEQARFRFLEFAEALGELQGTVPVGRASSVASSSTVPKSLAKVYKAVDDMLLSQISKREYLLVLDNFSEHLSSRLKGISKSEERKAVRDMLGGIEELQGFVQDQNEGHLQRGLSVLQKAAALAG